MYQGKGKMIRKFGENLIEKVKLYISPELVSMFSNQKRNSPKGFETKPSNANSPKEQWWKKEFND